MVLADCFFDKGDDDFFFGSGQFGQGKGDWPHDAIVEVGIVLKAECGVPGLKLVCALEEADDLAFLVGISRHAVPGLGGEPWHSLGDDGVETFGYGTV